MYCSELPIHFHEHLNKLQNVILSYFSLSPLLQKGWPIRYDVVPSRWPGGLTSESVRMDHVSVWVPPYGPCETGFKNEAHVEYFRDRIIINVDEVPSLEAVMGRRGVAQDLQVRFKLKCSFNF